MDYKKFESVIYELEKLLVEDGAKVTLNEKVRDQFTGNLRQVDIVIDRAGHRTCVECRAHRPKQDVKWIEELVGRADSIGATEIIGASLSGFTSPAIKMARARGVVLRDLSEIDAHDVSGWGKEVEISYRYCAFSEIEAKVNLLPQYRSTQLNDESQVGRIFNFLIDSQDFVYSFGDIICKSEKLIRENGVNYDKIYKASGRIYFGSQLVFDDIYISSVDVVIPIRFKFDTHQSTASRVYKDPRVEGSVALAGVSLFEGNDWRVMHSLGKSYISVDCNDFDIYENAMIYEVKIAGLTPGYKYDLHLRNPLLFRAPDKYKVSVSCSFFYTPILPKTGVVQMFFGDKEIGFVQ